MSALSLSPVKLFLLLDNEQKDDRVAKSPHGGMVLLINADIAQHLSGMTVDHQPTEEAAV